MMRPPAFWCRDGLIPWLLSPFGAITAAATVHRMARRGWRSPVPVICCGNVTVGGAGKTTVALDLGQRLAARGLAVHFVLRGYGGRQRDAHQVTPADTAASVGDEALLLAARAPCWVARDRAAGIRAAVSAGAEMALLDDGFQNPGIAKTLSLLVVDVGYGFGNGRVIPAGPLRESLARGLARATAVVLLGTEGRDDDALGINAALPVLRATLRPAAGERLAGKRLLAFAGIGRPEKFFATLQTLGAELVGTRPFPDHHPYRTAEIDRLLRTADQTQAHLITTAKDIVRVPAAMRPAIDVLEVEIHWADPDALAELLGPVAGV